VMVDGDVFGTVGCLGVCAFVRCGKVGSGSGSLVAAHFFFFFLSVCLSFLAMSSVTQHLHQQGQGIRVGERRVWNGTGD